MNVNYKTSLPQITAGLAFELAAKCITAHDHRHMQVAVDELGLGYWEMFAEVADVAEYIDDLIGKPWDMHGDALYGVGAVYTAIDRVVERITLDFELFGGGALYFPDRDEVTVILAGIPIASQEFKQEE